MSRIVFDRWIGLRAPAAEGRDMTGARKGKPVRVALDLDPVMVALLDATAAHLGKNREETVAAALRMLFVAVPRPGD